MIYDIFAACFAVGCLAVIISDRIHTGILGSIGVGVLGFAAARSIDDSAYADLDAIMSIITWMMIGCTLIATYVVLKMIRTPQKPGKWGRDDF